MSEVVLAVATHPDLEGARELARALVEQRLAACVQVLPGLHSTYRWEGAVETAEEVRLELKTTRDRLGLLRGRFVELHPYDVPELVVLDVRDGLPAYLRWVTDSCRD